jgi:galactoside 2-L-fucosyltransferase 1/2
MTIQLAVKGLFFLTVAWTISQIYQKNSSMSISNTALIENFSGIDINRYTPTPTTKGEKSEKDCINSTTKNCTTEVYMQKKLFHVFQGRLGNQLFQYASVVGIADMNNMVACLWDNPLVPFFDGVDSQACSQPKSTVDLNENSDYAIYQTFSIKHDAILDGFLQSYRYFRKDIRDIIQIKTKFKKQAQIILGNLPASIKVAIHIRKNYNTLEYLRMPGTSYYEKAMAYISTQHTAVTFVIVSDDINWCQTQPFLNSSNVFIQKQDTTPIIDLALLAECDHIILSRGTFGWWGAYLGAGMRNGIVVYYDSEFDMDHKINKGHVHLPDFYPSDWIAMGTN